jgi:hypothetical protein|tara:strand:+ start:248 stop:583 length:336 start_codon:yes stop_codon:yes gene_type:complete
MYHTESMIAMMEDMQRQASEMERNVKDMMEMEGRAWGIELDKRKNARELMHMLTEHQATGEPMAMTWAYVEDAADAHHAPTEWENSMHSPYAGATGEMLTESDLWHDDHQE